MPTTQSSLTAVADAIVACNRCARLRTYCAAVAEDKVKRYRDQGYWGKPVPGFGDPASRLLIVGLAPAAHGGNRTGRVFTGDSSGDWLYEALHRFGFANQPTSVSRDDGLLLTDCYVSASARCAPPDNKPLLGELENCRQYLEAEIKLLRRVRIIIVLGRIAHEHYLKAAGWWERLAPAERPEFGHGVRSSLPDGTMLLSSYHPSRQNTQTGRLTRARWHWIFRTARELLDPVEAALSSQGSATTKAGIDTAKPEPGVVDPRAARDDFDGANPACCLTVLPSHRLAVFP